MPSAALRSDKAFTVVDQSYYYLQYMWCSQVVRSSKFFLGMEAGRNVKVDGDDVAVL
jgi:hypothetical protein